MHVKCDEEWMTWTPQCKRGVFPPILSIHDCGCCGKIPLCKRSISTFVLDRNLRGVLDTWSLAHFLKFAV